MKIFLTGLNLQEHLKPVDSMGSFWQIISEYMMFIVDLETAYLLWNQVPNFH